MSRGGVLGIAMALAAAVLLAFGAIGLYADREIVDGRAFSERTAESLQEGPVREVLAEEIVGAVVDQGAADLLAVRPLLSSAIEALVGSRPFRTLFVFAVRDAHGVLLGQQEKSVILDLDRGGALLLESLRSVSPAVARRIPRKVEPRLAALDEDELEAGGGRLLTDIAGLGLPALLLGVALLAASILLGADRRAALGRAGMAVLGAAAAVWAVVAVAGVVVERHATEVGSVPEDRVREALGAVWTSLFGDLQTWALAAGAIAVAVAAVGSRAVTPGELVPDVLRRARAVLDSRHPGIRAGRGALAVAAGLLLILRPELALDLLLLAAGGALVFLGVGELAGGLEQRRVRRRDAPPSPLRVAARLAGLLAVVAAVAGTSLAIALPEDSEEEQADLPGPVGCNGSRAACRRRLNEIVIPATHNSFSAADQPGWLFSNQRFGIERQLDDGIRGFLLDVHYGVRQPNGRVRTDLRSEGSSRNRVRKQLSDEAVGVADRLVSRVGLGELKGERHTYLCHTLCELGARPFVDELRVISRFLEQRRREVVVLILEPYVPPAEIERSLQAAGLLDQVVELARDEPLPTLGDLVSEDRRLVVFTEADAGARPWYLPAFSFAQDTPLGARKPSELLCKRSRGDADSPLLLLNHWIDRFPPSATANAAIGRRSALLARAQRCARERNLVPNLIAVDYYDRSAVVQVARTLNRRLLRRPAVQAPAAAAKRRGRSAGSQDRARGS